MSADLSLTWKSNENRKYCAHRLIKTCASWLSNLVSRITGSEDALIQQQRAVEELSERLKEMKEVITDNEDKLKKKEELLISKEEEVKRKDEELSVKGQKIKMLQDELSREKTDRERESEAGTLLTAQVCL